MSADELSDPEAWVLLSLDSDSFLHELLLPVTLIEGQTERLIRPQIDIAVAAEALTSLVARGLAEVRAAQPDGHDPESVRTLTADEVRDVGGDPMNWRVLSEIADRREVYQVIATDAGEAAYQRASRTVRVDKE
jgi:hypothetical protein